MEVPTLFTARLVLRPWLSSDAGALFDILQEEDILRFFPRTTPPPLDRVEWYIAHHHAHWQERGYGHWAVTLPGSDQVIGWNGLEYLPDTHETEIAFLITRQFWGQGYTTEASLAAIRYGFDIAGLEQIIGLAHPDNIASRRVMEKCGMAYIERKAYWGLELCRYTVECYSFVAG